MPQFRLFSSVVSMSLVSIILGCPVIVEKGQPASLECSFPNTVRSVTWRLNGTTDVLTTCNFDTNNCTKVTSLYEGTIANSSTGNITRLKIKSASITATVFECVPDGAPNGSRCALEVYAWPQKPVCSKDVTETYVEITCTTSNFYPRYRYELNRKEAAITGVLPGYVNCTAGKAGSGSDGGYTLSCTCRMRMSGMRVNNTFYVEMSASVRSGNISGKAPSVSDDVTVTLSIPEVAVYIINCRVGPGVGGDTILIGTNATCRCHLTSEGFPPGHARWYDKYNGVVGNESSIDGSSTLTLSYNESDPNQAYSCWPVTPISGTVTTYQINPVFTSCFVSVEKEQSASLECSFPNNVSSVSWKLMNRSVPMDLITCSYNNCSSLNPTQYQASVSTTATGKVTRLDITSARKNETRFTCLADNWIKVDPCALEVYVKPNKPNCTRSYFFSPNVYMEYTCSTDNVYPGVNAVLHRRQLELTADDFSPGYPQCYLLNIASGNRKFLCVWRIPIQKVISVSTIYVEMTTKVSNTTIAPKTSVFSDDLVDNISIPQVNLQNCPVGADIRGDAIMIGTEATCTCAITSSSGLLNEYARWLDKDNKTVGVEKSDRSSVLHITYSESDPNPTYTCWPITPMKADVTPIIYKPKFTCCFVSVEKGQRASLECYFPNNVSSVSWKLMNGSVPIDLITCSYNDNNCSSLYPTQYQASISTTATGKVTRLNITSARKDETRFTCLADNGIKVNPCALEIYVKPNKPTCRRTYVLSGNRYLRYTCSTGNVYPGANAVLHRRELEITADDFAPGYPKCSLGRGLLEDRNFTCEWLIPIEKVIPFNTIYVAMTTKVTNPTLVGKTIVFSEDHIENISIPQTKLTNCPVGKGTRAGEILIGTKATCTCDIISSSEFLNDYARWLDKDNKTVGLEYTDGSSVLHITYSKSDPHPTYTCWPITKMKADVQPVIFRPKFTSSASRSFVVELQTLIIVLGAVYSRLVFSLH